ncbi:response regulator [Aquimarina sp. AU474]|uniref:response regulator n=1 Tax=Aquimarina sp. AU474 TaxID=2108529 RepID=UPI000D68847D|nr:response regulator [Aquimarina sp. AU474]
MLVNCTLLIDDDKATNFYNKKVLSRHDSFNEIRVVYSGKEALEYLIESKDGKNVKPNFIFLDLNMPAMNGWEFLVEFKKLNQEITAGIKIFIVTTSSDPNDINKAIENKLINDFINKPLSLGLLEDLLSKVS